MKFVSVLFLCFFTSALVANDQVNFRHLNTSDGLSQNDVTCVLQDSKGFMWFGTFNGLNRYDGYSMKVYRSSPDKKEGLNASIIFALVEDNTKKIWIGTTGQGISCFDLTTEQFTNLSDVPELAKQIKGARINCMAVDDYNNVWFGTSEAGLGLIRQTKQGFKIEFLKQKLNRINALHRDNYGRIWVDDGSLHMLSVNKAQPAASTAHHIELGEQNLMGSITTQHEMIYVSTYRGVYRASLSKDVNKIKFKKITSVRGHHIKVDASGSLWLGGRWGLAQVKRLNTGKYGEPKFYKNIWSDPSSISKNKVTCITEDRTGVIWVGTYGGGVNIFNPNKKKFQRYRKNIHPNSLSYNRVKSIFEDSEKNLWIGTEGGGVNLLKASKKNAYDNGFVSFSVSNDEQYGEKGNVYAISEVQTDEGNLIVCGGEFPNNLLYGSFDKNNKFSGFKPHKIKTGLIHQFLQSSDGTIWAGTYASGLVRFKKFPTEYDIIKVDKMQADGLPSNIIRSLLEDKEGNLWIGTSNGLVLMTADQKQREKPKFITFQHQPNDTTSISHNYILPIFQSANGGIWVGTMAGGLNRLKRAERWEDCKFVRYTENDGLPDNPVKGILEDNQGNLWVSSTRGLTKFTPSSTQIINYDISDGLQDNEFSEMSFCKRASGEMLFGGVNGFNVFKPFEISSNPHPPLVEFTDLEVNNHEIAVGDVVDDRVILDKPLSNLHHLVLYPHERSFAVSFVALHFEAPSENSFMYKLEGFDKEWIESSADTRKAKYTNIPPGKYELKIKAANSDGVWTETPKVLNIKILAPFYLRWWAFVVYLIAFAVVLYLRFKYSIITRNEKDELLLEHFQREKTQELVQTKLQFFTNISHELRTPITLLTAPLEKIYMNYDNIADNDKKRLIAVMYKNSSYLLRLINQLLDFRKIEFGKKNLKVSQANIDSYCKEIVASFSLAAKEKNITISFSNTTGLTAVWLDFSIIEKVLFNLLSNALKYNKEGGTIELKLGRLKVENRSFMTFSISDTGIGIPESEISHVFERFYRMNTAETIKIDGTGIGLAYVKNLTELHHGQIECTSQEGSGTTFTVTLPIDKESYADKEIRVQTHEVEPSLSASVKPVTLEIEDLDHEEGKRLPQVLVVEDNSDISQLIKSHLSGRYNVTTVENGQLALDVVKKSAPDIVISDVMMPVMDGLEMTSILKNNEETCHLPIILLTAKISAENKIVGYKTGADAYLQKPFNLDVLETRVENIIKQRQTLQRKYQRSIYAEPKEVATISLDEKFLSKVLNIIEENIGNSEFTVNQLASEIGYSQPILNKKLKGLVGQSARAFIRNTRLKRAAQLLEKERYSIAEITYEVGFNDLKYFRNCFKEEFKLTPSDYIKEFQKNKEAEM